MSPDSLFLVVICKVDLGKFVIYDGKTPAIKTRENISFCCHIL